MEIFLWDPRYAYDPAGCYPASTVSFKPPVGATMGKVPKRMASICTRPQGSHLKGGKFIHVGWGWSWWCSRWWLVFLVIMVLIFWWHWWWWGGLWWWSNRTHSDKTTGRGKSGKKIWKKHREVGVTWCVYLITNVWWVWNHLFQKTCALNWIIFPRTRKQSCFKPPQK